jgi:hypothetical protein
VVGGQDQEAGSIQRKTSLCLNEERFQSPAVNGFSGALLNLPTDETTSGEMRPCPATKHPSSPR